MLVAFGAGAASSEGVAVGLADGASVALVAEVGVATVSVLALAALTVVAVLAGFTVALATGAALAADGAARTVLTTWVTQKPFSSLAPAAQLAYLTGGVVGALAAATAVNAVGDSAADETAP